MEIVYSDHSKKMLRERGIETWEIEHLLEYPFHIKKSIDGGRIAVGNIKDRKLKVIFLKKKIM